MDWESVPCGLRMVEEVFRDFKGRRAGIVKALTTDVEDFHQQCEPEKENLCLYGYPDEQWEVKIPSEEMPPVIPEPALGINFARDGMQEKDWLSLVAAHSDAWLLSVAFYFGARFGFYQDDRSGSFISGEPHFIFFMFYALQSSMVWYWKHLFGLINRLPTIYEVVNVKNIVETTGTNHSSNKSKSNSKLVKNLLILDGSTELATGVAWLSSLSLNMDRSNSPEQIFNWLYACIRAPGQVCKGQRKEEDEGLDGEDEEEHVETVCSACGDNYASDDLWICCDICEKWFHGNWFKFTPARVEHIKQYKCPSCGNKRARSS